MTEQAETKAGYELEWVGYERVDKRRDRIYRADISAFIQLPEGLDLEKEDVGYRSDYPKGAYRDVRHALKEGVENALKGSPVVALRYPPDIRTKGWSRRYERNAVILRFGLEAARPSLIPNEEDAQEIIEQTFGGDLLDIVMKAVEDAVASQRRAKRYKEIKDQAIHLCKWICQGAREEAQKITRFDQRLAGLVAETDAEQKIQLEKLVTSGEVDENVEVGDGEKQFLPEAIDLAKKYAERYLWTSKPGSRFFAIDEEKIKYEEVVQFLAEAETEDEE